MKWTKPRRSGYNIKYHGVVVCNELYTIRFAGDGFGIIRFAGDGFGISEAEDLILWINNGTLRAWRGL